MTPRIGDHSHSTTHSERRLRSWMGTRGWLTAVGIVVVVAACAPRIPAQELAECRPSGAARPESALPLSRSGNRLIDQRGDDFQIRGDAAWSLLVQLSLREAQDYLDERRAQGFNTLVVELIEHMFADDPPRNANGDAPFLAPGDFSQPNPAYFDHAEKILHAAQERGFVVMLTPAYLGYDGGPEGWYREMVAAGPDVMRAYGAFVGERYRSLDNIVWLMGGDYTPPERGLELVDALQAGIAARDDRHLFSAHWGPETTASEVDLDWLDIDTTYTYEPAYLKSLQDHERRHNLPRIFIEGMYEDGLQEPGQRDLRAQAYHAMLTGAQGHVYGQWDVWQMNDSWRDGVRRPGAYMMLVVSRLFGPLAGTPLIPDDGGLLRDGRGEWGSREYAVAATGGRDLAIAYVPSKRTITLDLSRFDGPVRARWFDPTDGSWTAAEERPLRPRARTQLTTPGDNAAGDGDWALVLATHGAAAVPSDPSAACTHPDDGAAS